MRFQVSLLFLTLSTLDEHGLSILHIGTSLDRGGAIKKLLRHPDIDVNPVSKKGLTPIILATKNAKLNSLEVPTLFSINKV